ncbi:MAG: PLDc N-terminal domain-containing protein [Thermodesulfobacteriota bacterium]
MNTVTIIVGLGLLFYILTCWAVIDIAYKDFSSLPVKAAWGFTALIPFIGVVIYLIFGYRKGARREKIKESENNV